MGLEVLRQDMKWGRVTRNVEGGANHPNCVKVGRREGGGLQGGDINVDIVQSVYVGVRGKAKRGGREK